MIPTSKVQKFYLSKFMIIQLRLWKSAKNNETSSPYIFIEEKLFTNYTVTNSSYKGVTCISGRVTSHKQKYLFHEKYSQ